MPVRVKSFVTSYIMYTVFYDQEMSHLWQHIAGAELDYV